MDFEFDIKSNAIDSFNESLDKFEQGESGDAKAFKFAITHLSHFIELVLKMYLQTLDENPVYSKCYKVVVNKSKSEKVNLLQAFTLLKEEGFDFKLVVKSHNNPHTVKVDQALAIAKYEVCGITGRKFVDQGFINDINWMKGLRNAIEHYQFGFTKKDVRVYIGRLVRGIYEFTDTFSLFDLEKEVGKEKYHIFELLSDEYVHRLREAENDVSDAKDKLFAGVRFKNHMFVEWNVYLCDECEYNTMVPNVDSSTGYQCTYCENEESDEIEVSCDICGSSWPNGEMTSWPDTYTDVCPDCDGKCR